MANNISRRSFLQACAFTGLSASYITSACGKVRANSYAGRLGFQSYTVRKLLAHDLRGTLERIAAIGYKEIGVSDPTHLTLTIKTAREQGLTAVNSHVPDLFPEDDGWVQWIKAGRPLTPLGYQLDSVLEIAQNYGLPYIGYPHGAPDQAYASTENYKLFVDLLDRIGSKCRKAGVGFFYHNHWAEFTPIGNGTFFDIMVSHSDPNHVAFELDVCWLAQAGQDPATIISKLARRVPMIHLKDRKLGVPASTTLNFSEVDIRKVVAEVGSGTLDIPGILRASHAAGVEHILVEQDETPGDPIDSLAVSYAYVHKLGL